MKEKFVPDKKEVSKPNGSPYKPVSKKKGSQMGDFFAQRGTGKTWLLI